MTRGTRGPGSRMAAAASSPVREARELDSVAVAEFALHLLRHHATSDARVGHDRAPHGSGTGSETATACGTEGGMSCGPTRRKPTTCSKLAIRSGGRPHSGHANRYAAAPGVKRSRQLGQQTGVITDPFHRNLKDQSTPPLIPNPQRVRRSSAGLARMEQSRQRGDLSRIGSGSSFVGQRSPRHRPGASG